MRRTGTPYLGNSHFLTVRLRRRRPISKERRTRKKKQDTALVPASHPDFIDVLERVVTRGIMLEIEPTESEGTQRIAAVDVFKVESGWSRTYLYEAKGIHSGRFVES